MENLVNAAELRSFYKGKKVLITGHTGFKGAWLTAMLYSFGAKISGYALAPEQPNGLFDYLEPLILTENNINDIRDKVKLSKILRVFEPDLIFHLAAQPLVRRSYEMPAETFEINAIGTANLLEAASHLPNACSIIVITTDKVYHNKERDILYKEDDALGGYDPYSASKACAEIIVDSFRMSFYNSARYSQHKKSITSARAGNVIGGGDWSQDRILPDIVNSLINHKTLAVRSPSSVRPWQHVLEALTGYLVLGARLYHEPLKFSKPYNFGPFPEDHLSVKELVETAIQAWGEGNWKDVSTSDQPHEAGLLKLDIGRATGELGWSPKLNAREAIGWTMAWYRQSEEQKANYTFHQIKEYFLL